MTTQINGTQQFGPLPDQWRWSTIGEVCEKTQYGWTTSARDSGRLKFLRTTDISSGDVDWSTVPYCYEEPDDVEKFILKDGDIVVSRAGSVGKSFLVRNPERAVFASYLIRLRPKIDRNYLQYFMQSGAYWSQIIDASSGIAIPNVNASKLSNVALPVAPIDQQRRIVARIDELFGEIEAGEQELAAAKADLARYRRSVLKAAVTGELTKDWRAKNPPTETGAELLARILKERRARWEAAELAKMKAKGTTPKNDAWKSKYPEPFPPNTDDLPSLPEGWVWASVEQLAAPERYALSIGPFGSNLKVADYRPSGVPLVFVRHIRAGIFQGLNPHFVSADKAEELRAHSVDPGDILITKMGDPPGDAALYPLGSPKAIITADCIKWRPKQGLASSFLVHVLNSPHGVSEFAKITKGVAQQKVTLEAFSRISIPVPSASEQEEIERTVSERLESIVELEKDLESQFLAATKTRQSILSAAFSGRLLNDEKVATTTTKARHVA